MSWSEQDSASSIAERFADQARLRPEHPAIAGGEHPLTYAQLATLADRYARQLQRRSDDARGGSGVALLLRHDGPLLAGAIAALKCGRTVVTLNPGDPPARHEQIRETAQPQLLLSDAQHLEQGRAAGFEEAQIVALSATPEGGDPPPATVVVEPDDIAFLICTSGSTGRPKVVMQSHRNVLHNVLRYTNALGLQADDRLALLASLSGGQGLATAWAALLNGATLCPFPIAERGVTGLADWLAEHGITVFDTVPSVLRNFARTLHGRTVTGVRLVRLASEAASDSDFELYRRHFSSDCALASVLASSETGIIAQTIMHYSDRPPAGPLPVGRPADGIEVALLDEDGHEVSPGGVGELVVQSRYLSPGYWREDALTAARFSTHGATRRFRTGDLATHTPAGLLAVVGRSDTRIKIRGNRLQLEEVEGALAAHPHVLAAAVLARRTDRGDTRLTAYISPLPGHSPRSGDLRRWLKTTLPPHAIPAAFVNVDAIPTNAHGKTDRERLAALQSKPAPAPAPRQPVSETAELLAGLWADALELADIDHELSFLELGGDSLAAAQIAAGIHDLFGLEFDLGVFAEDPTITALGALVDARRNEHHEDARPPLRRLGRMGLLSFAQARFWAQMDGGADTRFTVAVPFRIAGPLDAEALRESIERVTHRHEILRTTYHEYDGQPVAIVGPRQSVELPVDDLRGDPDGSSRVAGMLASENERGFDLQRGPLLRWRLLRLADNDYRLLRFSHHLLHDAASWKSFFAELAVVYEVLVAGGSPPPMAESELQYLDYAAWERDCLREESAQHRAEVDWWQQTLTALPPMLELPFARRQRAEDAPLGSGLIRWGIPAEHSAALDRLGRAVGATYFMTRLAAFASLLTLATGEHDLLIGTPVNTRTLAAVQDMFGPFINYSIMRLRPERDASFRDWLGLVRRAVIDLSAHATLPWEQLTRELRRRDVSIPTASARFVAWSSVPAMRFGGIELEPLPRDCGEASGFRLGVNRFRERDACWAEFDPRSYDSTGVKLFLEQLTVLVASVCARPDAPLGELVDVCDLAACSLVNASSGSTLRNCAVLGS